MRIYISGPITGVENYRESFRKAKEALCERGYTNVINPAELCQVLPTDRTTYHEYMQICIDLINLADVVVMLPGWEVSSGCNYEARYAKGAEKPVEEFGTFVGGEIDFE